MQADSFSRPLGFEKNKGDNFGVILGDKNVWCAKYLKCNNKYKDETMVRVRI